MNISKRKKILLFVFILVALTQLWMPLSMISKYRRILEKGIVVKMKMSPRDPVHPFKGKYLKLNFEENGFEVNKDNWKEGERIYLYFHVNSEGFFKVDSVSRDIGVDKNIMKAKVRYFSEFNRKLTVQYPFDKYFIEESKALLAEKILNKYFDKSKIVTKVYAEVSVSNGNPVLKEVFVDKLPILNYLESE